MKNLLKNKKSVIAQTITWVVAIIIIMFVLIGFIALSIVLGSKKIEVTGVLDLSKIQPYYTVGGNKYIVETASGFFLSFVDGLNKVHNPSESVEINVPYSQPFTIQGAPTYSNYWFYFGEFNPSLLPGNPPKFRYTSFCESGNCLCFCDEKNPSSDDCSGADSTRRLCIDIDYPILAWGGFINLHQTMEEYLSKNNYVIDLSNNKKVLSLPVFYEEIGLYSYSAVCTSQEVFSSISRRYSLNYGGKKENIEALYSELSYTLRDQIKESEINNNPELKVVHNEMLNSCFPPLAISAGKTLKLTLVEMKPPTGKPQKVYMVDCSSSWFQEGRC
jgi:hypothetical protein